MLEQTSIGPQQRFENGFEGWVGLFETEKGLPVEQALNDGWFEYLFLEVEDTGLLHGLQGMDRICDGQFETLAEVLQIEREALILSDPAGEL
jgi:hypothetical protein